MKSDGLESEASTVNEANSCSAIRSAIGLRNEWGELTGQLFSLRSPG